MERQGGFEPPGQASTGRRPPLSLTRALPIGHSGTDTAETKKPRRIAAGEVSLGWRILYCFVRRSQAVCKVRVSNVGRRLQAVGLLTPA